MIDCAMARKGDEELRRLARMGCERTPDSGPDDCAAVDAVSVRVIGYHMRPAEWCDSCRARRELDLRKGE